MITIFNRKELLITYDMKKQSDVRTILRDHGIPYDVKTYNRAAAMRAGTRTYSGPMGVNPEAAVEYKIYVHKDEYDRAYALIGGSF